MSGNTLTESKSALSASAQQVSVTDWVRTAVTAIASLKLTVFLLVLAVLVTWIITLEQATIDIWALKNKHFSNFFVYVPLATFFPLNWFPNATNVSGGFVVPSGMTIITAMLINLTAAHVLRFRIQAKGARLWIGSLVLLASGLLTWTIIFNYQDDQGFGGQPPIPWTTMWKYLQVAVLGLGIASLYATFTFPKERNIERIVYALTGVTLFALLVLSVIWGAEAFIGDSAMRILWQLAQSTIAAMVVLVGCMLLFKRKAGIVLLHLGIAGLLVNEIFVTVTNEEHRVSVVEGETTHHAIDLRETEFVVIDRSDPEKDRMTVIPGSILENTSDIIDDPQLPFKIRCVNYFKNSDVIRVGPQADNKADTGIGQVYLAVFKKPAAGADASAGADRASAYIEIVNRKTNKKLGTYLVSQLIYDEKLLDTVSIDESNYQIGLRFKTIYMPYSIELKDTSAEYYVGTETPRLFSSEFVIDDPKNGIESTQKISMNNPLRYRDQTFYQTTYLEDSDLEKDGNQELSGIQVVRNNGWMIPYVCCMFVVVGLVAQFQQTLVNHLNKTNKRSNQTPDPTDSSILPWIPTIALVSIAVLYYGVQFSKAISPKLTKAKGSEIRLDLLGRVPVTFDGRVQPLDSYARNLSRQLSNREYVVDGMGKKQPAIRWFADMMFDAESAYDYQILRVEDDKVQNALDFPKRKGLKYTLGEVRNSHAKLISLLQEADKLPVEKRTSLHRRLGEVFEKSRQIIAIQTAFQGTANRYPEGDSRRRIEVAAGLADTAYEVKTKRPVMPFSVPTTTEKNPWMPLAIAMEHIWLDGLAKKYGAQSNTELAKRILDEEYEKMKPDFIKKKIIKDLMRFEDIVEGMAAKFKLKDPQQLEDVLIRNWHLIPPKLYEDEWKDASDFVANGLRGWRLENDEDRIIANMLDELRFTAGELSFDPEIAENLTQLKAAYQNGDAAKFNNTLEKHNAAMVAMSPTGYSSRGIDSEMTYNYFSPFYVATCMYLFAFVVTLLSWFGFHGPINRAAFWLIMLALVVHIGGVALRVVISGRPPITNLYSSFVVVAAGCVVILLMIEYATKIGIGNLLASLAGFGSLLYAWTISIGQGDTFTVLRAVLDTQFWLTTHVIIINLGYSATLVAGLVGLALLFGLFFSPGFDKQRRRQFTNIIYGTVCFALLFSFFGTVLGGLWADDSWGRFWGWDPKENGALMIVLWNAVILHARWAGLVKDRGIAALAAIGNIIVIWSWEGVNQLGVGLHAYADAGGGGAVEAFYMQPMFYLKAFVVFNLGIALLAAVIPQSWYRGFAADSTLAAA